MLQDDVVGGANQAVYRIEKVSLLRNRVKCDFRVFTRSQLLEGNSFRRVDATPLSFPGVVTSILLSLKVVGFHFCHIIKIMVAPLYTQVRFSYGNKTEWSVQFGL